MAASTSTVRVKIYAPFRTYFDGQASSVSAVNETGPFDILPGHKNFICLLSPGVVSLRIPERPNFEMQIDQAVMHVKANMVSVFLDV